MFRTCKIVFLLLFVSGSLLSLDRRSTTATAVHSADVVVDTSGNVYHMVYVRSSDSLSAQFSITKTDINGALVSGFGTSGVRTLTVSASDAPSGGSVINIGGGPISLEANQKAILALDPSNNLFLAFAVVAQGGMKNICVTKLLGSTGAIDSSFGQSSGVILNSITPLIGSYLFEDMTIDSSGRPITLVRCVESLDPASFFYTSRFPTGMGPVDNNTFIGASFSSPGCSVVTDSSNNAYVVGEESGEIFCVKILNTGFLTDSTYGTLGKAISSSNSGLDDDSVVFAAVSGTTVYVYTLGTNDRTIIAGSFNSSATFSTAGSILAFPSAAVLKSVIRRSDGKIYVAGTIQDGTQTAFLGRFNSGLSADTTFAQTGQANYLDNGIVKVLPTSGFTVTSGQGGWLGFDDTTHTVAVAFAETNGGTTQLTRDFGIENTQFLTAPTPVVTSSVVSSSVPVVADRARKDQAFAYLTLSGTNLTSIDDSGLVVTHHDDTICYLRSGNFYIFYKIKEDGTLDTNFNGNGHSKITLAASGATTTTAVVSSFSSMVTAEKSFIAYDATSNAIFVQFKVNIGVNTQIGIFKVNAETGLLDTTFGSGGVKTTIATPDTQTPQGVLVDRLGKVIFFVHYNAGGSKTVRMYKTTTIGGSDNDFGVSGDVVLSLSGSESPEVGFDCGFDHLENIYVAGQYLNSGNRGLFCARFTSTGQLDAAFSSDGIYFSSTFSELDGGSTRAFLSIYDYHHASNVQIVAKGTSSSLPGVVIQQLNISDGAADTMFGNAGKAFVQISNLTTLNQAKRNEFGALFCSGIITESAVVKSFLARITAAGVLDTTFGDTSDSMKLGIAKIDATSTWTVQNGGHFYIDSGAHCLFVSAESKNSDRQLIVQRILGTDDINFNINLINNGTDLISFILAHHFNSKNGLLGFIHLDGIADDLQKSWTAVGGGVDNTAISAGVSAFKTAVGTALERILALAALNNHGSCLSLLHKTGLVEKIVSEAVENAVTTNYTSMTVALYIALLTISKRLNIAYKMVTGNERNTENNISI